MSTLTIPNTFGTGQPITAASHNANFSAIATEYNAHAVQTDVAKTITVTHTFSAAQTFSGGLTSAGAINAAGQAVSGNFTGPLTGAVTGNVTGAVTGNVTGNCSGSAATLATPRAINGVNFDGSAPITVPAAASTLTGIMKPAADSLAADFVTISGTAVDIGLALTVGANEVWLLCFQGNLVSPAGGTQIGCVGTGTVTGVGATTVANASGGANVTRGTLIAITAGTGANAGNGAFWGGYRVLGGASGGTVKFQTLSVSASQTTTIGAGTGFQATRIA